MPKVKEKRERSLGVRLHLKGERCDSPKCAAVRKPYRPGIQGAKKGGRRRNVSEYGLQIKEKQKFKLSYGISEKNLEQVFAKAARAKEASTSKLVEFLERRLDNVVFRLGFAPSRRAARQLVVQGHILVDGRSVRSPGYEAKEGETISVKPSSRAKKMISAAAEFLEKYEPPSWLELDTEKFEGKVKSAPAGDEAPFETKLVVEALSK